MDYLYAIILGIVEGITEFLPISSTGHLIVTGALLDFPTAAVPVIDRAAFKATFEIFIQIGAIFAVLVYFWRDLLGQMRQVGTSAVQRFWLNVFVAFLPAAAVGFVLRDWITDTLFRPAVVGAALIVGGLVFLWLESRPRPANVQSDDQITLRHALFIGLFQVTALVPGVSRSGASIVGAMLNGLDRSTATRFSFFLAIPTLGLATVYQLVSAIGDGYVQAEHLPLFAVGTVVSFFVAWLSIAWLLRFVAGNSFRVFGYYRIVAGVIILALAAFTTLLG